MQHAQSGDQPVEAEITALNVGQFVEKNAAQFRGGEALEDAVGQQEPLP